METTPNYIDLITRYFTDEATADEVQLLAAWLTSNPENLEIFKQFHRTWLKIEGAGLDSQTDTGKEWNILSEKLSMEPKHQDHFVISPFIFRVLRIAALVLILMLPAFLLYRYFTPVQQQRISAGHSMMEKVLPDGTLVALNFGSSLEFPERFSGKTREVVLNGEAYFEVKHDASKPFVIRSGDVRINVLGTAFNVNTKEADGSMIVVLTRGKLSVHFTDNPGNEVILVPGEKVDIMRDQHKIHKEQNTDENYMAWKSKKLIFTNKSLDVVILDLNKVYHADIRLTKPELAFCRLTATFDNQTLESILNVLRSTLGLSITTSGSTVEINGHACK